MASPILVTLRIDPFYQRFLRAYFNCIGPVMEFPPKSDFNLLLTFLANKPTSKQIKNNLKPRDFGEYSFKVALPYIKHKDVFYYNYFSERSMQIFQRRIYLFFQLIFHCEMDEGIHNLGLSKKNAIQQFIERYDLLVDDEDRIVKAYFRYEERLRKGYYRWNSKKQLKNTKKRYH